MSPTIHPDRFDECQLAIEDKLIELIGEASDAGWHRDEILSAVTEIADNLALVRREDIALNVEMRIKQLMKKQGDL